MSSLYFCLCRENKQDPVTVGWNHCWWFLRASLKQLLVPRHISCKLHCPLPAGHALLQISIDGLIIHKYLPSCLAESLYQAMNCSPNHLRAASFSLTSFCSFYFLLLKNVPLESVGLQCGYTNLPASKCHWIKWDSNLINHTQNCAVNYCLGCTVSS